MDPTFLLLSVAVPAGIAGAVALAAFLLSRARPTHPARAWAGPVGVAAAFTLASPAILGHRPEWPPAQAADWMPFLGPTAGILAAVGLVLPRRAWALALLALLAAGFAALVLYGPLASARERLMGEGSARTLWLAAIAASFTLSVIGADLGARRTPHAGPPLALGLLTACTIAAALLAQTAKYAQFASLLGLGIAPIALAALLRRPWPSDRGLTTAFSLLNATLWFLLHFYADAPSPAAFLGALAPALLLVGRIPALAARPRAAAVAQALAVLAVGLAAVGVTFAGRPAPEPSSGGAELYQ